MSINSIKILVPVDLSDGSLHTVLYAVEFAKHNNGKVEIFYNSIVPLIYGESAYYGDGFGESNAQMMQQAYTLESEDAKEKLGEFKDDVTACLEKNDLHSVDIRYSFDFGDAIADVNNVIDSDSIDFLIVGLYKNLDHSKLVNKIAEKLLRAAKIPVFAVPEQATYQPIKNIAYATNYHKHTIDEIDQFLSFIKPFHVKVHCIHLGDMLNEEQQMMYNLKPYFENNPTIEFEVVQATTLNEGIHNYIKQHNIQLLGVHPHKANLWQQLFSKDKLENILHHTSVPVLSVH